MGPKQRVNRSFLVSVAIACSLLVSFPAWAIGDDPNAALKPLGSQIYAADFVATAATGVAINDDGEVTGTSYPDPGCGPFCLPTLETVVWRGPDRMVLPPVPGFSSITVRGINAKGWVAGHAGTVGLTTHAVVWKPVGNSYEAMDLGTLPGTTISYAIGIDDLGRVVGWSTTSNFPPQGSPFMWSESTGMVGLADQGFPVEPPLAMSQGGTVVTQFFWYQLDDAGSVASMPPAPQGFAIGAGPTAINDAGDQARFLISTGAEHPLFLFRFHHEGKWEQVSFTAVKDSVYGVGSINDAEDITATVVGVGVNAFGPNGLTQSLADLLSAAYRDRVVTVGGPMNRAGEILAQVMVGRATRLMRVIPVVPCAGSCIKIAAIQMKGRFVEDPQDPGHCTEDGNAFNLARVKLAVTSETGARLSGVLVSGRFLDDYWTNAPVSGITNGNGMLVFDHRGPCGVGAVAFLVDDADKGTLAFDRTVGVVTGWVIPRS